MSNRRIVWRYINILSLDILREKATQILKNLHSKKQRLSREIFSLKMDKSQMLPAHDPAHDRAISGTRSGTRSGTHNNSVNTPVNIFLILQYNIVKILFKQERKKLSQ